MYFERTIIEKVHYCPAVISFVYGSTYIIGCYQLVNTNERRKYLPEYLANINFRLGSLVLLESSKVTCEFECPDGGVFDLNMVPAIDSEGFVTYKCWAAHSNGVIGCYDISKESIIPIKRINTGSSMLCSLTVLGDLVFAGDSVSQLISTSTEEDKIIDVCRLPTSPLSGDPVWCLKALTVNAEKSIVISGCEDAKLRFIYYQDGKFDQKVKTVKDFESGVTSIAVFRKPNVVEDVEEGDENFGHVLYVGSYDEIVRVYYMSLTINGSTEIEAVDLVAIREIHIKGSGIWKLVPIESDLNWPYILVASMYSGAHILNEKSILVEFNLTLLEMDERKKILDLEKETEKKISKETKNDKNSTEETEGCSESNQIPSHLIYGVSAQAKCSQVVIASFYDKTIHIFEKCNSSESP